MVTDPRELLQQSVHTHTCGKTVAGSMIGSIGETQEMIDFAAEHDVTADIELVCAGDVDRPMERLAKGEVRYRFVIDVGNTLVAA
jgi:cinnamyl-alcohol dehydrogenase